MATIINGTNGTNGTNGASPTNGTNGGNASYTKNGTIGLDSLDYEVKGGKGGKGGNGVGVSGANGGNGGNATITINGNIANNPATTTLSIKAKAIGGEGGDQGTSDILAPGLRGNGGNATVTMNGNIINPNKAMTTIELLADAIGGDGTSYGNATATISGNIVQPKSALNVFLEASATAFGPDSVANHGNAAYGTKLASVTGNVVQGNIQNVSLAADAYPSNGTARLNGNIVQLSGNLTTTGTVTLIASGNVIEMTQNKVTLNKQNLSVFITQYNPYTTTVQNNEFYGTGTNTFSLTTAAIPGPYNNTVSINLANGTFTFNGLSNILSNFNSAVMSGEITSTLVGNNGANVLTGALGNDFLTGGQGNDALNGGLGSDTAIYTGNFADYTVAVDVLGNGTVTDNTPARDGLDTLTSIEFIQFADGTYNTALGLFVPVGPVNTAPVLDATKSPTLATVLEDPGAPVGAVGTLVSDLVDYAVPPGQVDNVTDADPGALLGIAVTAADANGSWFYSTDNGTTWNALGVVSASSARLLAADANTRLYFQPNANFNGAVPAAITFQAWDRTSGSNGGTGNASINGGTTAFSTVSDTASITVTAVNDAPAGTNNAIGILEDAPYALTAADFGFTDPNDTPSNTLLAVRITTLPGAGTLTNNGNPVLAGDVISVADIMGGLLVFTPAANATSPAAFTFQVQDNGGTANGGVDLDQTPNTLTFNITGVNDAPAGTSSTITAFEDAPRILTVGDFGFTDPNDIPANTLLAVQITTLPGVGTLTNNGNPVLAGDFVSVADIMGGLLVFMPAANASGAGYASFTFQVQDNGGTANGGVDLDQTPNTLTIDVTAVNDAPAGTDNTIGTGLNTPHIFTVGDFGFTDPTDIPANSLLAVVITTLPTDGTLTNNGNPVTAGDSISVADIMGGLLVFTPDLNETGTGYASFTFQVQDNGGTANGGVDLDQTPNTITIDVAGGQNYFGTPGDDNHMGSPFDDIMHVSAGNDTLDGAGHINGDTLMFDTAEQGVTASVNGVNTGFTVGGLAGTTTALNFEHLTGSAFNDILTGDANFNIISGAGGDDVLVATLGGDTLDGGANGAGGDTADFSLGTMGVTVDLNSQGAPQPVSVEFGNMTLNGIENVTGTDFGDDLTGDAGNNVLDGGDGADIITGGLGNDTIIGGGGIDTAVFSTQPGIGDVSWNGSAFVVTGPDGTDTVSGVEVLDDGAGAKVLLVGAGGYATIQDAINAAAAGDTIMIAEGTYAENVDVNKSVTLVGVGNVVLQGTFKTDNGIANGQVDEWLQTAPGYLTTVSGGIGFMVSADNVTLQNIIVDGYRDAVTTAAGVINGLTLNNMTLRDNVYGVIKPNATELHDLTINGGLIRDGYFGVYLAKDDVVLGQNAFNTTIIGTAFEDILWKGIYTETAQGNTLIDGITMTDVSVYGGAPFSGNNGTNGAGIDFNLKFGVYTGAVVISNFALTNVGLSNVIDPTGHQNAAAIALKGRDDPGHGLYGPNPADLSGLSFTVADGTIDGTATGIRAGEAGKANPGLNVTGPAVTIDNVVITNNLSNSKHDQIDNRTQSQMTILGTSGNDIYVSAQTNTSTGPIAFYGDAGNDYFVGGMGDDTLQGGADDDVLDGGSGGINTADYSDATSDGLVVNLLTGSSSGGGLGNDALGNIQNITGSGFNDTLIGDDNDNVLDGGAGNDILWGHGGFNQLTGGAGTDVAYYVGKETDYAVFEVPAVARSISGGLEGVSESHFIADIERIKFLSPAHVSDVDNDGTSETVFQNAAGTIQIEGSAPTTIASLGATWRAIGKGQFDPDLDRTADLLLQDSVTGDLQVVTDLTGAQTATMLSAQPGSNAWKAIATGDFNGDAASDVLLQNQSTGMVEIMFLNTNSTDAVGTVDSVGWLSSPGANWKAISSGDFNGDGKSDILWQNSTTKQVQVHLMDGVNAINAPASQVATGLTAVGSGDFNADGFSDVLFKNASGQAVVWFMYGDIRTGTKTIAKPGAAFNLTGAADVDGNGYSDLLWTDASNNATATLLGGPSSLASTTVLMTNPLTHPGAGYNIMASTGGG